MAQSPGVDLRSVLLEAIRDESDLEVVAEAATLLAADARFNLWVATQVKPNRPDLLLDLADGYEDVAGQVVESFDSKDSTAFRAAVRRAIDRLESLRVP